MILYGGFKALLSVAAHKILAKQICQCRASKWESWTEEGYYILQYTSVWRNYKKFGKTPFQVKAVKGHCICVAL